MRTERSALRSACARTTLSTLLLTALTACAPSDNPQSGQSPAAAADAAAFAPPTELTATLAGPNAVLNWKNNATEHGGCWVEFSSPGADFIKLDALPSDATTYRHPDLAPETKFIYRVLPFFGRASETVGITTGAAPADATPRLEAEGPLPPLPNATNASAPFQSVRTTATIAKAAPAELTVQLASPLSVDLRWIDRCSDEEGYLVEVSAQPDGPFMVCALLPPDANSFKKTQLPPETRCNFRVRAFFYGTPSNLASVTTGATPEPSPAVAEGK